MKVFGIPLVLVGVAAAAYFAGTKNVLAPVASIFKKAA